MRTQHGPHVDCVQRIYFVLSILAVPGGLGTIAGGVLIILSIPGHTAAACGAVVIFVGFWLTILPLVISCKVFHLRILIYQGRLCIAKSYSDDFNTARRLRSVPEFRNIAFNQPDYDVAVDPNRRAYLPQGEVVEEASASPVQAKPAKRRAPPPPPRSDIPLHQHMPIQPQDVAITLTESSSSGHEITKSLSIKRPDIILETEPPSEMDGNEYQVINFDAPARNVSSLYPKVDDGSPARTKM